jgi:hypothetical protein
MGTTRIKPDVSEEIVAALAKQHWSIKAIARALNTTPSHISNHIKHLRSYKGIAVPSRKRFVGGAGLYGAWSAEDDEYALHGPGTNAEKAAHLGRSKYAVDCRRWYLRSKQGGA